MSPMAAIDPMLDEFVGNLSAPALARIMEENLWRDVLARPEQIPPDDIAWRYFILRGGRGSGKTRPASERYNERINQGKLKRLLVVGRTAAEAREILVRGPSGLLTVGRRWARNQPRYVSNRANSGVVIWDKAPGGPAEAFVFSADKPDAFRGGEYEEAWLDELFHWLRAEQTFDMISFSMRGLGHGPTRFFITSTPKPTPFCKKILSLPGAIVKQAKLIDNKANLDPEFVRDIVERYSGTRLWRQEGEGELLEDNPNALWKRTDIDDTRLLSLSREITDGEKKRNERISLSRCVIGVDPQAAAPKRLKTGEISDDTAETGIVACGKEERANQPPHFYVLGDFTVRATPLEWGKAAIAAYHSCQADSIIAEANNGGEMVRHTIHSIDANVPVRLVHASRGKATRAQPVSALYEQHRAHHVGDFRILEDQMCSWSEGMDSPDRMDALVWAMAGLNTDANDRSESFSGLGIFR